MVDDIDLIEFHDARFLGIAMDREGDVELRMKSVVVWRREKVEWVRLFRCDATVFASAVRNIFVRGPIDSGSRVSDGDVSLKSGEKLGELTELLHSARNGVCQMVFDNGTEVVLDAGAMSMRLGACEATDEVEPLDT